MCVEQRSHLVNTIVHLPVDIRAVYKPTWTLPSWAFFVCLSVWVWQENRQLKAIDELSLIRTLWCCSFQWFHLNELLK